MGTMRMSVGLLTVAAAVAFLVVVGPASAAFEARNGLVAYATGGGEEDWIVRTVQPDGTQDRRLLGPKKTNWPLPYPRGLSGPRWSPDGKRLLLGGHHHYDDGAQSLWYATASGKRVTRIPLRLGGVGKHGMFLFGWDWAPDRRHVVFAAARGRLGLPTVYTISIDGKRRTALRRGWWPKWSGDGRHIVFNSRLDFGTSPDYVVRKEIAVMRADGSRFRRLTASTQDSAASFSPDGRKVVYVREFGAPLSPTEQRAEWHIVDVTGRHDVVIATHHFWSEADQMFTAAQYCPPQWTPDGERLSTVRTEYHPWRGMPVAQLVSFTTSGQDEREEFALQGWPSAWSACQFSWQPR